MFSPIEASKAILGKYLRYLNTSFNIGEPYSKEFHALLKNNAELAKGPYLDLTDTFKSGKSIIQLIEEGLLPESFSKINLNQTRPLYLHQEKALRKIKTEKKNIVVSTGTGSGKTESFLIPILSELAEENEKGKLTPGVRALLVYPMNALANDQIERLREILKNYPQITYGVYTGQTKKNQADAEAVYRSLNEGNLNQENEIISREKMIESPPHILVTNYAMLEYLMIRPNENVFFEGEYSHNWKFIVFDEAHVYSGSTGIEVSMLFRRLKAKLKTDDLRYILTSATLGEKENDEQVAEFAQNLCNAPFYKDDIVRAERVTLKNNTEKRYPIKFYEGISKLLDEGQDDKYINDVYGFNESKSLSENLYDEIIEDKNYWQIRELLKEPNTVKNIADTLGWTDTQVAAFVQVASLSEKNGIKLFDARYHMFLRATDSAFVTLAPDNRISLERKKFIKNEKTKEKFKVFEVATCIYCNSVYLLGKTENNKLEQFSRVDDIEKKEIYLLSKTINDTDEDHTLKKEEITFEEYKICPYCGFIHKASKKAQCEHGKQSEVTIWKLKPSDSGQIKKCPKCENVNNSGVLRQLYSGQEAATSVIGTTLFEELPADKDAKQFIAFSDNRQAAAFFATFLNATYKNILYKRIIIEALTKSKQNEISARDLVDRVQNELEKYKIGKNSDLSLSYNQEKEAWKSILKELTENNNKISLYNLGLLPISINADGKFGKLDEKEFEALCSNFILSMLIDAAIKYDEDLNKKDKEAFTYNGIQYVYTLSDSSGKYVKSFIPTKTGGSNKRIDYLRKILEKKDCISYSNDELSKILEKIWGKLKEQKLVVLEGNGYRVNFDKIKFNRNSEWFVCDKCNQITCHNIENVCPSYKCTGHLRPVTPKDLFRNNHYHRLYQELDIRELTVVEHTAQLDIETAYKYQKEFKDKNIDILSCSTTFEMGVDVGSLETVFMRNMPPSPANYAQRAGRAGRSKQSAAFALTFCNRASHDFSYFRNPVSMIKGKINPPKYIIDNDKIGIRHLYAATLGYFWRIHPEYFDDTKLFIEPTEEKPSGYECLKEYIESKPEDLKEYLLAFLPELLISKYDVKSFGWKEKLVGKDGVLTIAIEAYRNDIDALKKYYKLLADKYKPTNKISQRIKNYEEENIITFMSRNNILPKYGFPVDTVELEVVDENSKGSGGLRLSRDLSMAISEYAPDSQVVANGKLITSRFIKRDPRIGWKMFSYVKCPNCKTLNMQVYTDDNFSIQECQQCGVEFGETRDTKTNVFLIPEWGFVSDNEIKTPGLRKPARTYSGEISYVGRDDDIETNKYRIFNSMVLIKSTNNDEMAIINRNKFFVCEQCGHTVLDNGLFRNTKKLKHNNSAGYECYNKILKKRSIGYTFKTNAVTIEFPDNEITDWKQGMSILYAILRGMCIYLNIEEVDISGCLQKTDKGYSIVIFDKTPGGAGHAKRLNNQQNLQGVIKTALSIVEGCSCGGEEGDSSCYFCLRNYLNQRYHDDIKRKYVIDFLRSL